MRNLEYIIPTEYDGRKVLHFLRGNAGLSSRLIRTLKMYENGLLLNGIHTRTVDIIHEGDKLQVNIPEDEISKESIQLDETFFGDLNCDDMFSLSNYGVTILYEDEDLLVVDKPAVLAMHPSHNHQGDTLANLVATYCKTQGKGLVFRSVGRLDKGTSGIVVCAKNAFAANKLQGNIIKTYYAIPSGYYNGEGTINEPIYRPDPMKTYRTVDPRGDLAITHYKSIASSENASFLSVLLETGRTHQIRVHFAYLGTPLVGDLMYGCPDERICHQSLHCGEASFYQPYTGELIKVHAPIPSDMQSIIDEIMA